MRLNRRARGLTEPAGALERADGSRVPDAGGPPDASLAWIDGFFREMKDHIFAREEDGVVILPPNQVYKANATGIAIVRHMQAGGRAADIPGVRDPERARQVAAFVSDIRDLSLGRQTRPGSCAERSERAGEARREPLGRAAAGARAHGSEAIDAAGRAPYEPVPYTFQYTTLPILGEIAVTYRCNNACLFCYAGCGAGSGCGAPRDIAANREMSTAEVKRIIRIFKDEAQIPFFSFTGGEPLLRRDLETLVRFARRLGLEVNLITNGTLATPRRARSLRRAGLRTAQVSLESPDAETHDALTARPGSFTRTLAGIRCLQAAGISVQTNTTVTAANAADAPRMPPFLKSLGVTRFAMNLYIPSGGSPGPAAARSAAGGRAEHGESPQGGSPGPAAARADALFIPYSRAGAIIESIRAAARREGMIFYWYSPIPHCHYNTIARGLGNKSCAAMDGLLSVSPAGDVLPCSSYPESMGNLLGQGFRDIWFSPRALFFKNKEYAPAECAGCGGFTACQAACPLYWQRAGTAEIRNPNAAAREQALPAAAVR